MEWRFGGLDPEKRERLMARGCSLEEEDARSFSQGLAEFEKHAKRHVGDTYVPLGYFTPTGFALGAWTVEQSAKWRRNKLNPEQQYMLFTVGFGPALHPDERDARVVTRMLELILRDSTHHSLRRRQKIFRSLVMKYHPTLSKKYRVDYAEQATQFLESYKEWFLNPPPPPLPEGEGDFDFESSF